MNEVDGEGRDGVKVEVRKGKGSLGNVEVGLLLRVPAEGREAREEDVSEDAHGPTVNGNADRLVANHFRGHVLRCSEQLPHLQPCCNLLQLDLLVKVLKFVDKSNIN